MTLRCLYDNQVFSFQQVIKDSWNQAKMKPHNIQCSTEENTEEVFKKLNAKNANFFMTYFNNGQGAAVGK